ncbi:hypothetical protein ABE607_15830 [Comamonas aquatica]|jgi:hypothetical protein|uniref:hypothetical protein n=1 Tax=Comamonas aquatica TaxID=225991 RepID=UPI0022DCF293|nr:hypothetical protein [Comamonas aquatica]WBM40463.1 hypothetical protein M2J84_09685 [Comamonas aquatica]
MKNYICLAFLALLSGCAKTYPLSVIAEPAEIASSSQNQEVKSVVADLPFNCPTGFSYIPIPAFPAFGYSQINFDEAGVSSQKRVAWPDEGTKTNSLLTDISLEITKLDKRRSGELGIIAAANSNDTSYLLDFMKYRLEPLSSGSTFAGWSKVGVGLRVVITLEDDSGSIGGSLASLTAKLKASKLKGTMSINLVGVNSAEVTAAMPFRFGELTDATMERVLEGMTILKTQLYESKTHVAPRTLARLECVGGTGKMPTQSDQKK